jgi:Domain of unknown function (DUF4382)
MKFSRYFVRFIVLASLMFTMQACGSSSSSNNTSGTDSSTGTMSLSLTDAPGDFDHVYITVKDVWFHTNADAGADDGSWVKNPLTTPVTVDLISLANGNMQSIWNNIALPTGTYQQIRIVLVNTYSANPPAGHSYWNEVVEAGASTALPLRIPDAKHGIKLNGTFQVADGGAIDLAIDFDAGHDVVEMRHGAEYVLKPRLAYFDLGNVGAITGQISTGGTFTTTPHFVIKAEALSDDGTYHAIKRWTMPKADGTFILYPVSASTATYDLVVRGVGYQTTILKGVPVVSGTTAASNPTRVPLISMVTGTDYSVQASITSPTGAWVQFYETLPGAGEVPYEIRFKHFHPITGDFSGFPLSNSPLRLGTYSSGPISLSTITPTQGIGNYDAAAGAIRFDRSGYMAVSPSANSISFSDLQVPSDWTEDSISGSIILPSSMMNTMNKGALFAVHGGMIVNALNMDKGQIDMMTGGTYTMQNIPGGNSSTTHSVAVYGVEAVGWSSTSSTKAASDPVEADLSAGNAGSIDMNMVMLP